MKFFLGILLGATIASCASIVIPSIENRHLVVHNSGKLYYRYCADKTIFGKCKEWKEEFYDIADSSTQLLLKDFICINKYRKFK